MKNLLITCIISILVLCTCLKPDNYDDTITTNVIQLSPDSTSLTVYEGYLSQNIYYDYPAILSRLQYPNSSKAIPITYDFSPGVAPPGLIVKKEFNDTTKLLTMNVTQNSGRETFILGGLIDNLQSVCINENLNNRPAGNNILVRFVHAVPNTTNYDVMLGKQLIFSNKAFFSNDSIVGSYLNLPSSKDTFFVFKTGTNQLVSSMPCIPFTTASKFTLSISGIEGATNYQKIRMSVFIDNF